MTMPIDVLKANQCDIGAIFTEDFLNHFSESHHRHGAAFYNGRIKITTFDRPLIISYKVVNPIRFDLSGITPNKFYKLWRSHLKDKGADFSSFSESIDGSLRAFTPSNLRVQTEGVLFTFEIVNEDGSIDYSIDFEWTVEARCAVNLVDAGKSKAIRLEPIKVKFSKALTRISAEIRSKLGAASARNGLPTARPRFGDPNDPIWCAKVEQLIIFIVNQVLSLQMANFLKEWDLPRGVELQDSVSVVPNYVGIHENMLVAGAQVVRTIEFQRKFAEEANAIFSEFARRFDLEMAETNNKGNEIWDPNASPSLTWLRAKRREVELQAAWSKERPQRNARTPHPENIAIVSNDAVFDELAKANLTISKKEDFERKIDNLVRGAAGWWFRVGGAKGKVVSGGFQVEAHLDMGAYAEACIPNLDPKRWGSWSCSRLCIVFGTRPNDPFSLAATLHFWSRGIYGTFNLQTRRFRFEFCQNLPWPISELFNWFKAILEDIFTETLRVAIALVQLRLYQYPVHFPGTNLEWTPNMNTPARNQDGFLVISGNPRFK